MKIREFTVVPDLPEKIKHLQDLAMNMWFSWNWEAVQLFIRLDPELWEKSYQNPVLMLGSMSQDDLNAASSDEGFIIHLNRVYQHFQEYLKSSSWFDKYHSNEKKFSVAYFSCEYGIDEGLPIYSGGLGILAGDHLKSASDLNVPLVGVGLLYQKGYFQQSFNFDGWQLEFYPENDWHNMPVTLECDKKGTPILISVDIAEETVWVRIWQVRVGRNSLYLLDTNLPENSPHQRAITGQLYGGDRDMRIRQEIVLGIGGFRALKALGFDPTVYHINEGHSAFLALERIRSFMQEKKINFEEARELVWATNVFTTHTPVLAGNEYFDLDLVKRYFHKFAPELGMSWTDFLALGQEEPGKSNTFCMTVLALRLSAFCNGVSILHGETSRSMWKKLWQGLPQAEVPISRVTNGVHTRSWVSHDLIDLLERYLAPYFSERPVQHKVWDRLSMLPDGELWRVHEIRRERLVYFARKYLTMQLKRLGTNPLALQEASEVLSSETFTIGIARRFASYKRSTLILKDPERLTNILTNPQRPVQIIFAGKAHPHDNEGKKLIKTIFHFAKSPRVRNHVVFLENYDINIARYMVQGVDIWLNTPLRPLEASGTSGMKAAANGALNLSILDGWWAEAYDPTVGWAIGSGMISSNEEQLADIESDALYRLLESEVVPLFYDRDKNNLPRQWIAMMKKSIRSLGAYYSTHRMVSDYAETAYLSAHHAHNMLSSGSFKATRELAAWRARINGSWSHVSLSTDELNLKKEIKSGETMPIATRVNLASLTPQDVSVEVFYGIIDSQGNVSNAQVAPMKMEKKEDGYYIYRVHITCRVSGQYGFTVRAFPHHPHLVHPFTPLLITWEE
ncbi:MAG: alpha-glucan family phosphorylase [Thermodesulfobacteriota bacterium]|nr:alpha-glucan family phosphorylase [Thermodesulfobacteriota bacterium]